MSWSSLVEMLGFTETHQNTRGEEDMAVLGRIQARLKLQQSSTTTSSCSSPLQDHTFHTTNGDQYSKEGCQDGVLDCGNFLPDPIQCSMLEGDSFLGLFNSGILRTSSCPIEVGVAEQGFQQEQVLSPGMAREVNIPSTTMTSKSNGYNKRKVYDAEASVECIANKKMKGDCDVKEVNPKQETHNAATTVTMKKKISSSKNDDNSSNSSRSASKASEHVQKTDYIHVRARRGQATDSHSLAERVRREKISERMKYLQDLVPACNKITGKAGMLDEIINYVQSLQRQVEFLSMKLATVNPPYDFNLNAFMATGNENISTYGSCHVSATGVSSNISDTSYLSNLMQLQHSLAANSRLNIPIDISHAAIGAPLPDAFRNTSLGVLSAPYAWETEVQDVQFCQIKAPFQEANYLGEDMIPYNICMTS